MSRVVFLMEILMHRRLGVTIEANVKSNIFANRLFQALAKKWVLKKAVRALCYDAFVDHTELCDLGLQTIQIYGNTWWIRGLGCACTHLRQHHPRQGTHALKQVLYPRHFNNLLVEAHL